MFEDIQKPLVLDTSVWINVLATEEAPRIVGALGRDPLVPEQVLAEIKRDPLTKEPFQPGNHPLRTIVPVQLTHLSDVERETFLALVGAPAGDRLGDGEAAAIAVAAHREASLVIDERKARRILRESSRHPPCSLCRPVEVRSGSVGVG